jgi:membrane-associated phospholipid phosphatase
VEAGAIAATMGTTRLLKLTTRRERPDGLDRESFPSGHTSSAFVFSSLSGTNLEWFEMNSRLRKALQIGLTTMAAGTGWARIEAGAHYPSDVLFGAALGNFMAVFFTEAFLDSGGAPPVRAYVVPTSRGAVFSFRMEF